MTNVIKLPLKDVLTKEERITSRTNYNKFVSVMNERTASADLSNIDMPSWDELEDGSKRRFIEVPDSILNAISNATVESVEADD